MTPRGIVDISMVTVEVINADGAPCNTIPPGGSMVVYRRLEGRTNNSHIQEGTQRARKLILWLEVRGHIFTQRSIFFIIPPRLGH